MKLQFSMIVTNVYKSAKSGNTYVDGVELGNGGTVKLTVPGEVALTPGMSVKADIEAKGQVYRAVEGKGSSYSLVYQAGTFEKA